MSDRIQYEIISLHPVARRFLVTWPLLALLAADGVEARCEADPGTPALAVPATTPEAPGVVLWPDEIRPAMSARTRNALRRLPRGMDSTDYATTSTPGAQSGHELWMDVATAGEWLVVAYNAGLQVFDISRPLVPVERGARDGWQGGWLRFPPPGELDTYVSAVSAHLAHGSVWIALASSTGVGVSLWRFDVASRSLHQLYQAPGIHAEDVEVLEHRGRIYAYVAQADGIAIYDMVAADLIGPCVAVSGTDCLGVDRGVVTASTALYLDAVIVGAEVIVAASDGRPGASAPLGIGLWAVANSLAPDQSRMLHDGAGDVHSPQLIRDPLGMRLALVEELHVDIYDISHCLRGSGCATIGPPLAHVQLRDSKPSRHFLDAVKVGAPATDLLHYGMQTTGLHGMGYERLWLLGPAGRLREIRGGTYPDPCSGESVDWLGDYYPRNRYGLNRLSPRHIAAGKGAIYRAAYTLLDVWEWLGVGESDLIFADGFESGDTAQWVGRR